MPSNNCCLSTQACFPTNWQPLLSLTLPTALHSLQSLVPCQLKLLSLKFGISQENRIRFFIREGGQKILALLGEVYKNVHFSFSETPPWRKNPKQSYFFFWKGNFGFGETTLLPLSDKLKKKLGLPFVDFYPMLFCSTSSNKIIRSFRPKTSNHKYFCQRLFSKWNTIYVRHVYWQYHLRLDWVDNDNSQNTVFIGSNICRLELSKIRPSIINDLAGIACPR